MTDHVDTTTLALFREGLLDEGEAARVRGHLAGCARCGQVEAQFDLVTDLLASAPAPPMPAGLAARIEAALAAEAAARSAGAATGPAPALPEPALPEPALPERAVPGAFVPGAAGPGGAPGAARDAVPQPVPGSRGTRPPRRSGAGTGPGAGRPPRRTRHPLAGSRARLRIMAAAAAVVVVGGGGYAVAQYAAQSGAASSGRPAAQSQPRPASPVAGPVAGMGPNNAGGTAGHATISAVTSGTDYTARQLTSQVAAVLAHYPASSAARRPPAARALPSSGLASCVNAVTGGQRPRLVDVARYQGRQAVIIVVAGTATTPARAWVVRLDCSASRPDEVAQVSLPGPG